MEMDDHIIGSIHSAFCNEDRPSKFTREDSDDPDCVEFNDLFQSHTRSTLPIEPLFSYRYPLSYLNPQGMKYYFPTLARIALIINQENQGCPDWTGENLLVKLEEEGFRVSCNAGQKSIILKFLHHLKKTRLKLIKEFYSERDFEILLNNWQ
jgi:hypothetical protein